MTAWIRRIAVTGVLAAVAWNTIEVLPEGAVTGSQPPLAERAEAGDAGARYELALTYLGLAAGEEVPDRARPQERDRDPRADPQDRQHSVRKMKNALRQNMPKQKRRRSSKKKTQKACGPTA